MTYINLDPILGRKQMGILEDYMKEQPDLFEDENVRAIRRIQEENENLRKRVALLEDRYPDER